MCDEILNATKQEWNSNLKKDIFKALDDTINFRTKKTK